MDYDGLDVSFSSTDCYYMKWIHELNWNGIIILEDLMIVAISAVYILYHYSCGCTCLYSFCCQTSPLKNYQTYVEEWIESSALGREACSEGTSKFSASEAAAWRAFVTGACECLLCKCVPQCFHGLWELWDKNHRGEPFSAKALGLHNWKLAKPRLSVDLI